MEQRIKLIVILLLSITIISGLCISKQIKFSGDRIIRLIQAGEEKINTGELEKGLTSLTEAKELLISEIVALSPGERSIKTQDLIFSIDGADKKANVSFMGDYSFSIEIGIENLHQEEIEVSLNEVNGVKIEPYIIDPKGIQHITFGDGWPDHIPPGVKGYIKPYFYISKENFTSGQYTIMVRIEDRKKEIQYIKRKVMIKKSE